MLLDTLARRFTDGSLTLRWPDGRTRTLGQGEPHGEIHLHRRGALWRILRNPSLTLGESYVDGDWDPGESGLLGVLEVLLRNIGAGIEPRWLQPLSRLRGHLQETNWVRRSRRNASHHYDLDEALFRRFLDRDLQYSCAYFEHPDLNLDDAQRAKCRHVGRKLMLHPGDRVLDIGCGWGGLAMHLAKTYDVHVTGLTLAEEQLRVARQRSTERGLSEHTDFRLEDYRANDGQYDAIVSVGMFEHVGRPQYQTFFDTVYRLLKPGGRILLHTIGRSGPPTYTNPWIHRYIFPGGYIPALSEVAARFERSGLVLSDLEVLRLHYAKTLSHWHARFQRARGDIAARMGERFCRMWEFYLQVAEASFRWSDMVVFQFQLARENDSVPLTRDYLYGEPETAAPAEPARPASVNA